MKPTCKLVGTNGNVFAIIGRVSACLIKAQQTEQSMKFQEEAVACGSYDEVLRLVMTYVEVE